jgi:S-layer protein
VLNGTTGERVGIKPVYKTVSEPSSTDAITVTAGLPTTTSVTVLDNKLTESADVTFQELAIGEKVTVGNLIYTATAVTTAEEVAAAFANLEAGTAAADVPAAQIPNGTMEGTLTGFSTGANTSDVLTFTSDTSYANVENLTYTTTGTALSVTNTNGTSGLGVTEESVLTFPAMGKGQTITVAGLTYTATVANSGAEVAEAFANLADGATTGASTKGTYSGTLVDFSSGPKIASSNV